MPSNLYIYYLLLSLKIKRILFFVKCKVLLNKVLISDAIVCILGLLFLISSIMFIAGLIVLVISIFKKYNIYIPSLVCTISGPIILLSILSASKCFNTYRRETWPTLDYNITTDYYQKPLNQQIFAQR